MTLLIFAVLALGLLCGNELSLALFGHPTLNRQPIDAHILVRSSYAALFGRVMPFWMTGSAFLNLAVLLNFEHLNPDAWRFAAIAFGIQIFAILFSLVAPVPINNRIAKWTPGSLPADWKAQEHRWDVFHSFRTCALIVAFVFLTLSVGAH